MRTHLVSRFLTFEVDNVASAFVARYIFDFGGYQHIGAKPLRLRHRSVG